MSTTATTATTTTARTATLGWILTAAIAGCDGPTPAGPRDNHDRAAYAPASASASSASTAAAATADALDAVLTGEVRAELDRYYADFSARDWPAFSGHFWPGATITTAWQPPEESAPRVVVTGVPEFVAQAPKGPGSKAIFEEKITGAETRIQGNLAQVWARYDAKFGDPGDVREWSGIDAFTLMKHDGQWKIVALAFTTED